MSKEIEKEWFEHDSFKTNFFNAGSLAFPKLEHLVVTSVNHFYNQIKDERLKEEIKLLTKEELAHTEVHKLYNEIIKQEGFNTNLGESLTGTILKFCSSLGAKNKLAFTLCFEHFTAILAKIIVENNIFENVDPRMKELWTWHSLEEIEHRGVAFDLYSHLKLSNFRRYLIMILATLMFFPVAFITHSNLLIQDKVFFKIKTWKRGIKFLWGSRGIFTLMIPLWFQFFKKDFNPNKLIVKNSEKLLKNKKETNIIKEELKKYFI